MGIVNTTLKLINPSQPTKFYEGEFLVDTGAQYTVIQEGVWGKSSLNFSAGKNLSWLTEKS